MKQLRIRKQTCWGMRVHSLCWALELRVTELDSVSRQVLEPWSRWSYWWKLCSKAKKEGEETPVLFPPPTVHPLPMPPLRWNCETGLSRESGKCRLEGSVTWEMEREENLRANRWSILGWTGTLPLPLKRHVEVWSRYHRTGTYSEIESLMMQLVRLRWGHVLV